MLLQLNSAFDPSQIKLLVFDLDGTLVDAFEDIRTGVNFAMRACALPELSLEKVKNNVGDGVHALIQRCLGEFHADRFHDVLPIFRDFYRKNPQPQAKLYPGAVDALKKMHTLGFHQAILSNKPHDVTMITCDSLGISNLFSRIWGDEEGQPRKPDPAALEMVMRHFDVVPDETAMIGDGPADHKVAHSVNASMIAVTYGVLDPAQTRALRPAVMLDHLDELAGLFERTLTGASALKRDGKE